MSRELEKLKIKERKLFETTQYLMLIIVAVICGCEAGNLSTEDNVIYNKYCSDEVIIYEALFDDIHQDTQVHIYSQVKEDRGIYIVFDDIVVNNKSVGRDTLSPVVSTNYISLKSDGKRYRRVECD